MSTEKPERRFLLCNRKNSSAQLLNKNENSLCKFLFDTFYAFHYNKYATMHIICNLRFDKGDGRKGKKTCYVRINPINGKEKRFMASARECKPKTAAMCCRDAAAAEERRLAHK